MNLVIGIAVAGVMLITITTVAYVLGLRQARSEIVVQKFSASQQKLYVGECLKEGDWTYCATIRR